MSEQPTRQADEQAEFRGKRVHVNGAVLIGKPAVIIPKADEPPTNLTEEGFEDALDKASRPVSGRYTRIVPKSEDEIDAADALEALAEKGEVPWTEVKRKHGL